MHLSPLHLQLISMCFYYIVWEIFILLSLQKGKGKKMTVLQSLFINLSRKIYLTLFLFTIKAIYSNTLQKE